MTPQFTPPLFEMKADPQGLIEGVASSFNGIDSYGDQVAPGAYTATLMHHKMAGTMPSMLWSHRTAEPIGKWTAMQEAPRGLVVHGQLNLRTDRGAQAFEHLRAGDLSGLSVGYDVPADGAEMRAGVRVLKALRLHEVSVVSLPADTGARISSVKERGSQVALDPDDLPQTLREFERFLHSIGYSKSRSTAIALKGFRLDTDDPNPNAITPADIPTVATGLLALFKTFRG